MSLKEIIGTWKCMLGIGADFENQVVSSGAEGANQTKLLEQGVGSLSLTENGCGEQHCYLTWIPLKKAHGGKSSIGGMRAE